MTGAFCKRDNLLHSYASAIARKLTPSAAGSFLPFPHHSRPLMWWAPSASRATTWARTASWPPPVSDRGRGGVFVCVCVWGGGGCSHPCNTGRLVLCCGNGCSHQE